MPHPKPHKHTAMWQQSKEIRDASLGSILAKSPEKLCGLRAADISQNQTIFVQVTYPDGLSRTKKANYVKFISSRERYYIP